MRGYLKPFSKKAFWPSVLIDAVAILVIVTLFVGFGNLLNQRAYEISDGRPIEQLKADLLVANEEHNKEFLRDIQIFTITMLGGTLAVIVMALLFFSYTRALLWSKMFGKRFSKKRYWKWNGLNLVVGILLLVYLFAFGVLRFLLTGITNTFGDTAFFLYSIAFSSFFMLLFAVLLFYIYNAFIHSYKVWDSVGVGFSKLGKLHWKKFGIAFVVGCVVNFVFSKIAVYFPVKPLWAPSVIGTVVLLIYFSWVRLLFNGSST